MNDKSKHMLFGWYLVLWLFLHSLLLLPSITSADVIVDNGDIANTSTTGIWNNSGGPGSYGTTSIFARQEGTHTWQFDGQPAGEYEVLMWWTVVDTRGTNIDVEINAATPVATTVDQTVNGGAWNSLGTYYFDGAGSVTITATDEFLPAVNRVASTSADAVWFRQVSGGNAPPEIIVFDVVADPPLPGAFVFFDGEVVDSDGVVVSYQWVSSLDGLLSDQPSFSATLTEGIHTISLTVIDDEGGEATESQQVVIGYPSQEVIIDNGADPAETESTGAWSVSSGPNSYGTISVFARPAATYTWKFNGYPPGVYEVDMWWTAVSTRGANIEVEVTSLDGVDTLFVNQSQGGGQWNNLGSFSFDGAGDVTIYATSEMVGTRIASTCADAVRFRYVGELEPGGGNALPEIILFDILADPPFAGEPVYFEGEAVDSDGAVVSYGWTSDVDGFLSDQPLFSGSLTAGTHQITLTVTDDQGAEASKSQQLIIGGPVVIIDNGVDPVTTESTGTWRDSGGPNSYGTTSVFARPAASYTWRFDGYPPGTYEVDMWWTSVSTRGTSIQVDITSLDGLDTVYVDQSQGGGQWNTLGRFSFDGAGDATIYATSEMVGSRIASTCADAVRFRYVGEIVPDTNPSIENIYIVNGYVTPRDMIDEIVPDIEQIGAVESSPGVWTYTNTDKGVTYYIREVKEMADYEKALRDPLGHIVIGGHSNYGAGLALISRSENGHIDAFDAPKWYNGTSDIVTPDVGGMRNGNDYVNWQPFYRDGTPAIAPYTFSEGLPPYNYYLSYEIPGGDGTRYFIERPDGSYFQRFGSNTQTPVWDSPYPPDPVQDAEYFVTNPDPEFNHIEFVGNWPITEREADESKYYSGTNFQVNAAGTGNDKATIVMMVRYPGWYQVYARWQPRPEHATNAVFTINHANGATPVTVDQTVSDGSNDLGVYYFNYGRNTIVLTDDADGTVCVDRVDFISVDDVPGLTKAEFSATNRIGNGPLTVEFSDRSLFHGTSRRGTFLWDFGDGTSDESNTERNPVHTYAAPGVYTVSLTVADTDGVTATEVKENFVVVDTPAPPLTAQFRASSMVGWQQLLVNFYDQSTGNGTSWHWDFGDGSTSDEQNPFHVYKGTGEYTVTLTVTGPDGTSSEVKEKYLDMLVGSTRLDNDYLFKPHYYSTYRGRIVGKIMMDARKAKLEKGIDPREYRYQRMAYLTCFTGQYYMDHYQRGIMFYTHANSRNPVPWPDYVRLYLLGSSDDEILNVLNNLPYETYSYETLPFGLYGYYDFTQKPPSMR